ncbi:MAG: tyrosine--tRNA ligase [Proteobacteria bacterium]|nr:tyrosine--tRNA ligase [Pseudomonadota bacterium]
MSSFMPHSAFLQEALMRGFIHQCTDFEALDKSCQIPGFTFYVGFDATAKSLHVGNLVQIMLARLAQRNGLRPLILMGGGTTKIGDPSGKTELRQMLSEQDIYKNIENIKEIFSNFLIFGSHKNEAKMVNNDDWLSALKFIDFLRDYGRFFSVNRMLTFDSIKLRLEREQPLSFIEFNYMIFQSYDFLELYKRETCRLQIGGSDQWGNIVSGVDFVRRVENIPVFGLTTPLITTSSGAKMGKTAQGAVWLKEDLLSPYDYWQFWRNTEDQDVEKFLKLFTDLPLAEISNICASHRSLNEAKKILADQATELVHGSQKMQAAHATAESLFESEKDISSIEVLERDPKTGKIKINSTLPCLEITSSDLEKKTILDLFIDLALCKSKSEVRRLIEGKGVRLNDAVIEDEAYRIDSKDFFKNGLLKLSVGKKRHGLVYMQLS